MARSNKHVHIWKSYERSLQHVFHFNQHSGHAKAHLSTTSSLARPLLFTLLICGLVLGISLFVLRVPALGQYYEHERTFSLYQQLSYLLVYYSSLFMAAVAALALKNLVFKKLKPSRDLAVLLGIILVTTPFSLLYSYQPVLFLVNLGSFAVLLFVGRLVFRHYSYAGLSFYLANCLAILVGLVWGVEFFVNMPASAVTKGLMLCTIPLLLVKLPSGFLQMLELYDVVCREHWSKLRHPYPKSLKTNEQFVSIHVPTYSEPPEIVIETLDKLAAVDYQNYEVIVIDNNTKDSALWLPVQAYCEKLGSKFRFIHADNIQGAKGGALNYIHHYIDPRATIISVVDADYQVDPGFLKALVGHFDNPKVGFIQTPHDYRDWQDNLFLTMCYWEYKIFFHSTMISLNERDAGITVGTMCLVRKTALEKAGGWSEWCVTEDSELAIRIHDQGYSSIYVDKTYGRGLIPDSFEGYKKQRYRWTAGPVQEFRHYYKHFIGLSKKDSKFNLMQRIFHLNHGLGNVLLAFNIPLILVGIAVVASMIFHHEVIAVPIALWIGATVTLLAAPLLTFILYRVTVKATIVEIAEQAIATKALSHVIAHAALRTAVSGSAQWNRTNKFKSTHSYFSALFSTKEEAIIGLVLWAFVIVSYLIFPYQGLSLMLLIGVIYMSLAYFAAPLMAIIGVWSLKREAKQAID